MSVMTDTIKELASSEMKKELTLKKISLIDEEIQSKKKEEERKEKQMMREEFQACLTDMERIRDALKNNAIDNEDKKDLSEDLIHLRKRKNYLMAALGYCDSFE